MYNIEMKNNIIVIKTLPYMKKVIVTILFLFVLFQLKAQTQYSEFKRIDSNLYLIWFNQFGNKSLIAEFDDYIVVVEFPQKDTVVKAIVNKVKEVFPTKPIKYVFHTHHHSHSASGFDSFLELTDAYLVTSSYNFEKIKALTKDTIKLNARYINNDSVYFLKSKRNELICYVVKQTQYLVPTNEYNLIYFPKQKVVVSGCLYQKPLDYHEVVNDRKLALNKFIVDNNIDAKYFIPTNTTKKSGFEDICTIGMLDSTLKYGIKPNEVADFFQSKSLEYLESKRDSLLKEIKKIPIYYDYYQCGRTLMERKDYDRALIIFLLIPEIYSDFSHNVYLCSGECCEFKGNREVAKVFYEKYIDCAVSESEVSFGKEKIINLEQ